MSHRVRQKLTKSNDLHAANLFVFYLFNFIVCSLFFFFGLIFRTGLCRKADGHCGGCQRLGQKSCGVVAYCFSVTPLLQFMIKWFRFRANMCVFFFYYYFFNAVAAVNLSHPDLCLCFGDFFCFNKHYLRACDIFLLLRDRLIRLTSGWVSSVVHLPGSQVYLSHDVMAPYLVSPLTFAFALVVSRRQHAKTRISVRHAHCETQRVIMAKQQYTHNR